MPLLRAYPIGPTNNVAIAILLDNGAAVNARNRNGHIRQHDAHLQSWH